MFGFVPKLSLANNLPEGNSMLIPRPPPPTWLTDMRFGLDSRRLGPTRVHPKGDKLAIRAFGIVG